jgi:predicted acyltransferase
MMFTMLQQELLVAEPSHQQATLAAPTQRVLSIDILRGLTIALMILVNDPGDGLKAYAQLDHADWNGFTLTDLVFPIFLLLIGCSIVYSTVSRLAIGESRKSLALHIVRRSAALFLIGCLLHLYPDFHLSSLRFFGVLQRIALCYLCSALLFLWVRRARDLVILSAVLLIGYWLIMRFAPVPGAGHPVQDFPILDRFNNPVSWFDRQVVAFTQRWLHTGTLYKGSHANDPMGVISTLPAIVSTLIGIVTGLWMRSAHTSLRKFSGLFITGAVLIVGGVLWNPWFPLNKNLWTSSYVLLSAGIALVVLAVLYWLIDIRKLQDHSRIASALLWPWRVFGTNAIFAYVIAETLNPTLDALHLGHAPDGTQLTLNSYLYAHVFAANGSTAITSLMYSLTYVFVCFLPVLFLWRRRIFLKL